MNLLPARPLSPEQQQKVMEQMYLLLGSQIQSYHKHRRMGNNSSVPLELAQDLMKSIEYTVNQAGGVSTQQNLEESLKLGQAVLDGKLRKAKKILDLVIKTAPDWQTECRWEAIRYLCHYLDTYDHLHLAHKGPEDLFYPILISPPEDIHGIDSCLFYLNILWTENQIMSVFPDEVLARFWSRIPADTLNQCEPLLLNGMGKVMIGADLASLTFETENLKALKSAMKCMTSNELDRCAETLCQLLKLDDENARKYVNAIIPQMKLWTGTDIGIDQLNRLFI